MRQQSLRPARETAPPERLAKSHRSSVVEAAEEDHSGKWHKGWHLTKNGRDGEAVNNGGAALILLLSFQLLEECLDDFQHCSGQQHHLKHSVKPKYVLDASSML
ncbi:mCG128673 [Mus musculus]|nr:mCG128673 [Mus musculus]